MTQFNHSTGKYLEVGGANIYYEEQGNKDKPALIVLHGGFQNMEDMNSLLPCLVNDFRVIGIDTRGHGKSTLGNQPLSYERLQHDVEALIHHLGITSVTILGFSDGGMTGLRLAAIKTVHIEKLIAMDTSWSVEEIATYKPIFMSITPDSAKAMFADSYMAYQQLNPEPQFEAFAEAMIAMWTDTSPAGHPDQLVKQIDCPVLLIRGDNDFLTSLESTSQLRKLIPNASFLNVPFAEHVAYEEQNTICQDAIKQFLAE